MTNFTYPRVCFQATFQLPSTGLCSQHIMSPEPHRGAQHHFKELGALQRHSLPLPPHPDTAELAGIRFYFLCVSELSRHPIFNYVLRNSEYNLPLRSDTAHGFAWDLMLSRDGLNSVSVIFSYICLGKLHNLSESQFLSADGATIILTSQVHCEAQMRLMPVKCPMPSMEKRQ